MQNEGNSSWLWKIIPSIITSYPSQMINSLSNKPLIIINFIMQGIFFSGSIINFISSLAVIIGFNSSVKLIRRKWIYYGLVVMFFLLSLWEINNQSSNLLKGIMYVAGFYVSAYAVQGCFYVKQKINRIDQTFQNTLQNDNKQHNNSILKEICLISLTLLYIFFFIFIWYNIKIIKSTSNRIKQSQKILPIIIISTLLIFSVSVMRKISLLYPLIVCCFFLEFTIFLRILFDTVIYVTYPKLYTIGIPFQAFIFIIFGIEGKERHQKQAQRKENRMLIEELFWACAMFYLYCVTHDNVIYMQYMVVVIYVWQVIRKCIY